MSTNENKPKKGSREQQLEELALLSYMHPGDRTPAQQKAFEALKQKYKK